MTIDTERARHSLSPTIAFTIRRTHEGITRCCPYPKAIPTAIRY